jgi:dTDP-4-amino-4,6-dideoxygalactose transaminase
LELSIQLLNLSPGDEVIIPSFTFTSTANCIVLAGGTPVFVDVNDSTLNITAELIETAISPRTKAVVVVHYAGVSVDMDPIASLAESYDLVVVEDNAHGFGATYKERPLGSIGALSTLSFHETKNIQCGEGGALLINEEAYIEPAEIFREKGTNRSKFFRGQVDKYTWTNSGSSLLLSDILAGLLNGQLESRRHIQEKRMHIWNSYASGLKHWADENNFRTPVIPDYATHPAHLFYLRSPGLEERTKLILAAKEEGVTLAFHYQCLHKSEAGRRFGKSQASLPISESASDDLVRLPIWPDMTQQDIEKVIEVISSVRF